MFIAVAMPNSAFSEPGLDVEASRRNLGRALVDVARLAYPFAQVEIVFLDAARMRVRIFPERPGRSTDTTEDALETAFPLAAQTVRAGERLDRLFGTILKDPDWRVMAAPRAAA